jgi:hypothetical protein
MIYLKHEIYYGSIGRGGLEVRLVSLDYRVRIVEDF